jgi:sulfur-carrier protein
MRVTLKLYATLSDRLPPGTQQNALILDVPEETTPAQLIEQHKLPLEMVHLVLRNGVYLNKDERSRTSLKENDILAIWPPIAGG